MKKEIGVYEIGRCLSRGEQCEIYEGRIPNKKKSFAIKIFSKEISTNRTYVESIKKAVTQIIRLDHTNLILLYGDGTFQNRYYYVMDCFDGFTLEEMLYMRGFFEKTEAIHIVLQIALALAYSSMFKLFHGSLAPNNIFIDKKNNIKIMKVGLPVINDNKPLLSRPEIIGNPQYRAPEQIITNTPANASIDIFSLGAIFYHLLTGMPPFEGWDDATIVKYILEETPIPIKCYTNDIPEEIIAVVDRMMTKKPENRYPDFKTLLTDLQQLQKLYSWKRQKREFPTLRPIKYNFAFVPNEADVIFAQIAAKKGLTNVYQLEKALDRQEAWGMNGTVLSLSDVLEEQKIITTEQRAQIESAKLEFLKMRSCYVLYKTARLYSLLPESVAVDAFDIDVFENLHSDEQKWRRCMAFIKHLISHGEANALARLARDYKIINQGDFERCVRTYCNNVIRGKYREVGYLLGNKFFVSSRHISLLLRALRRSRITRRSTEVYMENHAGDSWAMETGGYEANLL